MKTTVKHGNASVRDGQIGSHVELHLDGEGASEWSGVYSFSSHGMTADQFVTHVDNLKAYHQAKMSRLNTMKTIPPRALAGVSIAATLRERGTDVELVVGVTPDAGKTFTMDRRDGMLYPSVAEVPDNQTIVGIVRARMLRMQRHEGDHAAFVAEVAARMGV